MADESLYHLRVERLDGVAILLRPGGLAERDLTATIATAILADLHLETLSLGLFVPQALVEARVKEAVRSAAYAAVADAFLAAKSDILPHRWQG